MIKAKDVLLKESQNSNEIQQLYAMQVSQLYKHIPVGVVATFVNSLILMFILWEVVSHSTLIIWFSALTTISVFRLLFLKFERSAQTFAVVNRWGKWCIIGIVFAGIAWGSAGIFLFPIDSLAHQVFIAFVLGGMVAGAVGTYSVMIRAFLAFSLPALIPIIIRFLFIGQGINFAIGGMTLLFELLMISTARRVNAAIVSSLKLQFKNRNLVEDLKTEKNSIEKLNLEYEA